MDLGGQGPGYDRARAQPPVGDDGPGHRHRGLLAGRGPAAGEGPRLPDRRSRLVAGGQAGGPLHAVHPRGRADAADRRARRRRPGLPAHAAACGRPRPRRPAHRLRADRRGGTAVPAAGAPPRRQPVHPGAAVGGARGRQHRLGRGGPGPVRQRRQPLPVPARPAGIHPGRGRLRGRHRRMDRFQPQRVDDPDLRPGRAGGRRADRRAGGWFRAAGPGLRGQPGHGPGRGPGQPGGRVRRDGGRVHLGLAGLDGRPHPAGASPAGDGAAGTGRRAAGLGGGAAQPRRSHRGRRLRGRPRDPLGERRQRPGRLPHGVVP